jgi:hypothetical protein
MTKEQSGILDQDFATIMQSLGDITTLLNAYYGSKDRVARAEEAEAALQRLLWALERQDISVTVEDAVGSARVREIVEVNVRHSSSVNQQFEIRTRSPRRLVNASQARQQGGHIRKSVLSRHK